MWSGPAGAAAYEADGQKRHQGRHWTAARPALMVVNRTGAAFAGLVLGAVLLASCGADAPRPRDSPGPNQAGASFRPGIPDGGWRTFDYDAHRGGVGPTATGITKSNLHSLRERIVRLTGVADSSAIQLHSVSVAGKLRDVDVVTTTYGRTIAFDPATGARLWEYAPKAIGRYQGSSRITTASPVADPDRRHIYAASPDGFIHKLAINNGHQAWSARVTFDSTREKIAGALNLSGRYVIVTTGGYFGDQPRHGPRRSRLELAVLGPASPHPSAQFLPSQ